jgi:hypothetical protein
MRRVSTTTHRWDFIHEIRAKFRSGRHPSRACDSDNSVRIGNAKLPTICVAALLLVACDSSPSYRGDGTLSDMGLGAAHERYVVDLGPIDLSKPGHRSFKFAGLPSVEFTIGLRSVNVLGGCGASALSAVGIRLRVQTENGAIVVDEEAPLSAWVASSSLVYRRGAERQEPRTGGAVEFVRTGVRTSGGWGTYFTPQSATTYVTNFEVLTARGASGCESRLVLLGGGWK